MFTVWLCASKSSTFERPLALECGAPPGGRSKVAASDTKRPTHCEAEGRASCLVASFAAYLLFSKNVEPPCIQPLKPSYCCSRACNCISTQNIHCPPTPGHPELLPQFPHWINGLDLNEPRIREAGFLQGWQPSWSSSMCCDTCRGALNNSSLKQSCVTNVATTAATHRKTMI